MNLRIQRERKRRKKETRQDTHEIHCLVLDVFETSHVVVVKLKRERRWLLEKESVRDGYIYTKKC